MSVATECGETTYNTLSPTIPENVQVLTPHQREIKWTPFLFIIGFHLLALTAFLVPFSWKAVLVCFLLHWISGGLGITLGYHRLLTHRSFKAPKWIEYILAVMACLACQAGPISWVAAHRLHHAKSDKEGDPHSPLHGFFWAHMGWCLSKNKNLDDFKDYSRFVPDLSKDRILVLIDRLHILPTILLGAALYFWGGWSFVVWGIFVRTVLVYHCTWLVNSAAHVWGYRTYEANDQSTNNWWVALVTYGEGWHNNHHAFQYSARHGLKWWEIDTTYWMIQVLKFFGLATAIKIPPKRLLESR